MSRQENTLSPLPVSAGQPFEPPKKRLFMGLVAGITALASVLLFLVWLISYLGLKAVHPSLPAVFGLILAAVMITVAWAALALALQSVRGRPFQGADRIRAWGVKFFLPLAEFFGTAIGFSRDAVRRSFIKVNNELALSRSHLMEPANLLVLLPHCLQRTRCEFRLTHDVNHCKRCGACSLGSLLDLRDKYGVKLAVATGGSVARLIVVQNRPRLILAVACERDLASGIQDTYPLPVFGILNERPEGPCRNTIVSLELVEKVLRQFIRPELLP